MTGATSTLATLQQSRWHLHGIPLNPLEPFVAVWAHRSLLGRLAQREVQALHRGSMLGWIWLAVGPLLLLAVYTFVFTVVFQARLNVGDGRRVEYALGIFIGLILFNIFADTINSAAGTMRSHRNYVKQVVFPLEIIPLLSLASALVQAAISLGLLLLACIVFGLGVPATVLFVPLIVAPLLMLTAGLAWFIASLGVYILDIGNLTRIITRVLLFLCPIFYSLDVIGEPYRTLILLNPLTVIVTESRAALFHGEVPHLLTLMLYALGAWIIAWLGYAWFVKTRKGFADVL